MIAWRTNHNGVLVPVKPVQSVSWPRPVGFAQLPKDMQRDWDAKWQRVQAAQVQAVK